MASSTSTATTELDLKMMKKAMILLHSNHPNSATELREMLDELIKQRYGPEKMLCNTLTQEQLDLEKKFPGRADTPTPQQEKEADEVINLTHSPAKTISDSPNTIADSEEGLTMLTTGGDDDGNLKEFGDLNCCVCGEMMFTATNRLIECSKCGALYHQECHKPPITDEDASEDQQHNWQCDTCFNKPSTSKAAGIVVIPDEPIALVSKPKSVSDSPPSSLSSSSSEKVEITTSKHHKTSSSSSLHKERERSSSSSSKGGVATPAINVISAGEKASSHSSTKKSHSTSSKSSSKSSKHYESSSSKRKQNK